jgi:hypothetical protein
MGKRQKVPYQRHGFPLVLRFSSEAFARIHSRDRGEFERSPAVTELDTPREVLALVINISKLLPTRMMIGDLIPTDLLHSASQRTT